MRVLVGNSQHVIEISEIDGDWDFRSTFPDTPQLQIHSVQFTSGSGTTDKCVLRDGGLDKARMWEINSTDSSEDRGKEFNGLGFQPYLDYSGGTYSAGSFLIIILSEPPFVSYKPGRM